MKPADLESLTEPGVGGATVPPEILALYRERFGREVAIGYGMTEAPTAVAWTDGRVPPRPGLCGRAVSQLEIQIVGVLEEHPAVAAAAVFGVPDERLGERVVAAVQLEGGAAASEKTLRSHARERLARYKVPEAIRLVAEMPRNAMGKIVKRALLADWPTSPASDS